MIFWENLIIVLVSVLVPIVPAYLLYKLLPGTADVSGPFQGLGIKLTGAFGGYFLVLLVIIGFWKTQTKNYEIWKVSGWANVEESGSLNKSNMLISVVPSARIQPDGTFEINVLKQVNANGEMDFPMLVLEQPGSDYDPAVVHLSDRIKLPNPYKKTISKWSRNISIDDAIVIKKKPTVGVPTYTASGPAPAQAAAAPTPPPQTGGHP